MGTIVLMIAPVTPLAIAGHRRTASLRKRIVRFEAGLFHFKGCLVYVEDPDRGADEDDDGDDIHN